MQHVVNLKCLICGKEYGIDEIDYVCPDHGGEGIIDVQYDYDFIGRQISKEALLHSNENNIWRYKPLLPVQPHAKVPPLSVGWTPLYHTPRLAADLGFKDVWVKDDGRQPTASFKDRASAVAVVKAKEKGVRIITTASTGNAAAALSGLCASMQQPNVIFVPEAAPQAKIAQLLVFGSRVILVKGTYDDAFELCLKAARTYGWYNRNTGYNPYMTEGKKTAAYEICEQLGWHAPDRIFVSVGDGCIIGGLHKGLKDLMALGWIDKMPKLMGVQAAGSSYMYTAWKNSEDILTKPPVNPRTVADSISAGLPRDRIKAMAAVKETDGAYMSISDDDILRAIPALARGAGVFAEPAGAASYAGFVNAVHQQLISRDEKIVVLNTGNGLKDVAGAMQAVELVQTKPFRVQPDFAALEQVVADWGKNEQRTSNVQHRILNGKR
ncbi:MAG: threonine synthase [Thermodesulfobacteriota bacterium]|nr:threonine synthase [Thermodesulfobacteriota bacterium]